MAMDTTLIAQVAGAPSAEIGIGIFAIPALILFFVLLFPVLIVIALLAGKRTRRVGLAILAVIGVGLGLMIFAGFLTFAMKSNARREAVLEKPARALAEAIPRESGEMPYDIDLSDSSHDENSHENGKEATEDQNAREEALPQQAEAAEPPVETPSANRPAWVETPPKRVGDVYQVAVVSEPYTTKPECDEHIDRLITIETAEYLDELLGEQRFAMYSNQSESRRWHWARNRLSELDITPHFIRQNICKDEFDEIVASSVGPMHKVHVLMKFDKDVEVALRRKWKESQIAERLTMVGVGAAALLSLVGMVFAYLKIDTVTKGFYTRRLQVAATVGTIIVIAALFAALA